jgi:guanidinoacetate N-methyltransferase
MTQYPNSRDDWREMPVVLTDTELTVGGWQVMQAWERPLMAALADIVCASRGDVLEVGFGMGISANEIMRRGCRSYTVIEAHPVVAQQARAWGEAQNVPVQVLEGFWEDVVPTITQRFDAILFDTYPLSESERSRNHFPFIPVAPALLNPNGVLTYYSDETVDFRPDHLSLLLAHFHEVTLRKVTGLEPYPGCEYWTESHMVIPLARVAPETSADAAE